MDYSRFMTDITRRRKGTILRELFNLQVGGGEDWIFLIGGIPNPALFPLTSGDLTMADGTKLAITEELMQECLQYGPSAGYGPFVKQLEDMVQRYHDPPASTERMLLVTNGAQDGLSKAMGMMMNPGDYVLMEEPVYSSVLSILGPYAPRYLPLETDEGGLKPESLRAVLSRWNPEEMSTATKDVPKFLYMNPTGCNPTGTILKAERRRQIYDLCCQYNLIILEDDPYYFQQYQPEEEYPPSFLRLDTEGRVMRFDSFSKIIGGGLRVGFCIGPKPLVEKMLMHQQITSQHTSNIAQVIISEMLKTWGPDGFEKHLKTIKEFYNNRRDAVIVSAEKHLKDICEWSVPKGGLFLWLKVKDIPNVWDMIMEKSATKKVVMVPGNAFMTDMNKPCQYIRVPFSHCSPELVDEAFRRFAEMVREEIVNLHPGKGKA